MPKLVEIRKPFAGQHAVVRPEIALRNGADAIWEWSSATGELSIVPLSRNSMLAGGIFEQIQIRELLPEAEYLRIEAAMQACFDQACSGQTAAGLGG